MILMKKSMLVFMSCIFCVFAANAGFLSGLKMTVYYPYQVRTVMPMTGPSVVQCNYADPEITVMFSSDGVPTEVMEKGNSYELEYYDTFDGNDIYTMDEASELEVTEFIPHNGDSIKIVVHQYRSDEKIREKDSADNCKNIY